MTELTGLELRKAACEALGYWWEGGTTSGYWHTGKCPRPALPAHNGCDYAGHPQRVAEFAKPEESLPAIESDSSVSESMFLEWCEKKGYEWRLTSAHHRKGICLTIWDCIGLAMATSMNVVHVDGSTPSEARARAIVEASKR